MKSFEVRIVKRRLACYQDILKQAAEKDREALLLQAEYERLAGAKAISYEPKEGVSGGFQDKTHLYTQIFTEQLEADRKAAECRAAAARIKAFINAIDDERRKYLQEAYINGRRFWEIGEECGYTREGIQKAIDRCLEGVPSEMAAASGLL